MDAPFKVIKQPKDLADYILKYCARETYLVFDRKKDICVCTRCQSKKKISRMNDGDYLQHNAKHFCYDCRTDAICKEYRYGRKNITDYGRILFLTKRGNTTYGQLDEYIINYDKLMIPSVSTWTSAQYKFSQKEQLGYKHHQTYYYGDHWTQMKEIKIPALPVGIYGYVKKFEDTYLYSNSTYGTDLKYANLNMRRFGAKLLDEAEYTIKYIDIFLKYKSVELLEKSGFENVVGDRVSRRYGRSAVYWRGKTLRKILRMNNAEIKEARRLQLGLYDLMNYRDTKKEFPGYDVEDTLQLHKKMPSYDWDKTKKEISRWVPISKVEKYLLNQGRMTFNDYRDYLDECNRLGFDMKNKKVLFPANLAEAHEETSTRIRVEADKMARENFARFEKEITSMEGPYEFGEYLIRPAANPEELHKESQALHHCVRTYVNKVGRGDSAILFIRKKEEPDKPLFTLELDKDRSIVQCRGKHNCTYPEDVADFIEHWKKDVVRKIV